MIAPIFLHSKQINNNNTKPQGAPARSNSKYYSKNLSGVRYPLSPSGDKGAGEVGEINKTRKFSTLIEKNKNAAILDPLYISGFTDAEGHFGLGIISRQDRKTG